MLWSKKKRSRKQKQGIFISLIIASDLHLHYEAFDDIDFPSLSSPPMYYYTGRAKLEYLTNYINNNTPDVALIAGDIVHSGGNNLGYDTFMDHWNTIDDSVLKLLATGNHDASIWRGVNDLDLSIRDYTATKLGYIDNIIHARSYFNQAYEVNKDGVRVKFIHVETNINIEGDYDSTTPGYIHSDTRTWVSDEIDTSNSNIIVLFSHKGDTDLDNDDKILFNNMLDNKILTNPNLKIIWIFAHKHRSDVIKYSRNSNRTEYCIPALIDLEVGKFCKMNIDNYGNVVIETLYTD